MRGFRAWDKKLKYMDYNGPFWIDNEGNVYDTPQNTYDTPNQEIERTDDLIVMRDIGLKDYRGKRIFPGDIVKVNDTYGSEEYFEVRYMADKDYPAYDLVGVEVHIESNALQYYHCVGIVEVVGNIYENPELLEEDK